MTVTLLICIVTGIISYQAFNNRTIIERLKHYPVAEYRNKEYYRFLSSGFVHGSWIHLLINLFVLYQFGTVVEGEFSEVYGNALGRIIFTVTYLLTIIVADLPTYFRHKNNPSYSAIGASGGVSGIVFSFILFHPWQQLSLYGIIPFKAIIGGLAYLVYSSWASKTRNDGIDHSAHFYGAVFGMVFTVIAYPEVIQIFLSEMSQIF